MARSTVVVVALAINLLLVRNVRRTVRGLNKAIRVAQAIAQRDLSQRSPSRAPTNQGHLLQAMKDR